MLMVLGLKLFREMSWMLCWVPQLCTKMGARQQREPKQMVQVSLCRCC